MRLFVCAALTSCLFFSCGEAPEANPPIAPTDVLQDTLSPDSPPPPLAKGDQLTAWVDGLFIRADPDKQSEILLQLSEGTPLTYTGRASDLEETIVLRGTAFREPWLEVLTTDSIQGWVFAGALQRPGETKGMGYRGPERFEFAHFGAYDLADWTPIDSRESSGGDAESIISVYDRAGERLTVRQTDMGDYGYERVYTLTDTAGNVLRTREFRFETDPAPNLVEIVTDFERTPPRQYRRTQALSQNLNALAARPEMAYGPWVFRTPQ